MDCQPYRNKSVLWGNTCITNKTSGIRKKVQSVWSWTRKNSCLYRLIMALEFGIISGERRERGTAPKWECTVDMMMSVDRSNKIWGKASVILTKGVLSLRKQRNVNIRNLKNKTRKQALGAKWKFSYKSIIPASDTRLCSCLYRWTSFPFHRASSSSFLIEQQFPESLDNVTIMGHCKTQKSKF